MEFARTKTRSFRHRTNLMSRSCQSGIVWAGLIAFGQVLTAHSCPESRKKCADSVFRAVNANLCTQQESNCHHEESNDNGERPGHSACHFYFTGGITL